MATTATKAARAAALPCSPKSQKQCFMQHTTQQQQQDEWTTTTNGEAPSVAQTTVEGENSSASLSWKQYYWRGETVTSGDSESASLISNLTLDGPVVLNMANDETAVDPYSRLTAHVTTTAAGGARAPTTSAVDALVVEPWDGRTLYSDFIRDGVRALGRDHLDLIMLYESPSSQNTSQTSFFNRNMTVLKLLGPAWTRAFRCVWMLEELGIPYHIESVMPRSPEVRKYCKSGKIPVLLEFDNTEQASENNEPSFVLYESTAINTYLGDTYGQGTTLVPPVGGRDRARYDQTVACILSELDAQCLQVHMKHESLAFYFGHSPEAVRAAEQQFATMNTQLADQLNPYLLGQSFTAADIVYMHCLDWSKSIGWHTSWPDFMSEYRDRCQQRPAYQQAKRLRDQARKDLKGSDSTSWLTNAGTESTGRKL